MINMALETTLFWQFLSTFGDVAFWLGVATTALIIYRFIPKKVKRHMAWLIFGVLPAVIISYFITIVLKFLFKIPRPCSGLLCPTDYSFPSGHATVIFAVLAISMVYLKDLKMKVAFFIFAILVALSRFVLGLHRIEDVIVGSFIGLTVGILVYKNYREIMHFIKHV